jgi:hypothetical protein
MFNLPVLYMTIIRPYGVNEARRTYGEAFLTVTLESGVGSVLQMKEAV